MDGKNHFIRSWVIIEGLRLVRQPQELLLSVPLADVYAEGNERRIRFIAESVGVSGVRRNLNGDSPLVVFLAGRTPGAVLFLHDQGDPAISADAVIAACLPAGRLEYLRNTLRRGLSDHTVGRNSINRMSSLPGMVRAQFGVRHQRAVRISHKVLLSRGQSREMGKKRAEALSPKHSGLCVHFFFLSITIS